MTAYTYAIVGGLSIGLAAVVLFAGLGRIAGISGIFGIALRAPIRQSWATLFIVGLGIGGWLAWSMGLWDPGSTALPNKPIDGDPTSSQRVHPGWLLAGGLLVGFGTRMGSGCTSGHGVCGTARLSLRSVTATITFVLVGMLVATLLHGVVRI